MAFLSLILVDHFRDLTDNDIPLLENVLSKCKQAISDRYRLTDGEIRAVIHYHPAAFWHLNVEFTYQSDIIESMYDVKHVISTLKANPDYFRSGKLPVKCRIGALAKKLEPISKKDLENFSEIIENSRKKVLADLNK